MPFDPSTARLTQPAAGGFDPSTAKLFQAAPAPRDNSPQGLVNQIPGGHAPGTAPSKPQSAGSNWLQSAINRAAAPLEAGLSMLSGAAAAPIGSLYGLGYGLTHGYGTQKGANVAEQKGAQLASRLTYHPLTSQGQELVGAAGNLMGRSGVMGLGPDMSLLSQATEGARLGAPVAGAKVASVGGRAVAPIVRGAKYLASPEASAGAKGARAMGSDLQAKVPQPGAAPMPPRELPVSATQRVPKPSTITINKNLSDTIDARGTALDSARQQAGAQITDAVSRTPQAKLAPEDALYGQLDSLKSQLIKQQERAGASATRQAFQTIITDIGHIQENSDTPLSSLIELRRQLSQKAKFGEPVQGFDAIGAQNAKSLSSALNDILDQHIEGYKAARGQYANVLDQQDPLRARLFKSIGADETTGDLTARAMASPENMKLTIEAAGGVKPVDAAIAQRVISDLNGKSLDAMRTYADQHAPVLKDLPQASKALSDTISRAEAADALKNIQQSAQKAYANQMDAYTKSHALAQKYQGDFIELNALPPNKLPTKLRGILSQMYNDKIISAHNYVSALDEVKQMEKSIARQTHVRRLTGAATALGFAQYALHRKMWNIIVGATH